MSRLYSLKLCYNLVFSSRVSVRVVCKGCKRMLACYIGKLEVQKACVDEHFVIDSDNTTVASTMRPG